MAIGQSFRNHNIITTGSSVYRTEVIEVADTDNDGDLDILANMSGSDNRLYLLENKGNQEFEVIRELDLNWGNIDLNKIQTGDINNDGLVDIVYSMFWYNCKLKWLKNVGDNNFEYVTTCLNSFSSGWNSVNFSLQDLNGDSIPDIVIQGENNNIKIKINQGDGSFNPNYTLFEGGGCYHYVCADIDNDNDIDIIYNDDDSYVIGAFLNDGTGSLIENIIIDSSEKNFIYNFSVFDTDNDNDQDILGFAANDTIVILENDGNSNFSPQLLQGDSLFYNYRFNVVDIDNDNDIDLINRRWHVMENLGNNSFVFNNAFELPVYYKGFKNCDLNKNGKQDIIFGHSSGAIGYIEDVSLENFQNWKMLTSQVLLPRFPNYVDIDGDRYNEICLLDVNYNLVFFENNGSGEYFDTLNQSLLHRYPNGMGYYDINQDGLTDIVSYGDESWANDSSNFKMARNIGNKEFFKLFVDDFNYFNNHFSYFIDYDNDEILNAVLIGDHYDNETDSILILNINPDFSISLHDTINFQTGIKITNLKFEDIDGNGENDMILVGDKSAYIIYSTDHRFPDSFEQIIQLPKTIYDFVLANIDENPEPDIILISDEKLYVIENYNGKSTEQLYTIELGDYFLTLLSNDLNEDGIDEIVAISRENIKLILNVSQDNYIIEEYDYENRSASYSYSRENPYLFADIDLDGDSDLLCTNNRIADLSWFENSYILQNFPMENAVWTEQNGMYEGNPPQTWTSLYVTETDTLLNNKSYTNIYEYYLDPVSFDTVRQLYASVRQDTLQKKVHIIRHYLNEVNERLLLDFNVEEGDTVVLGAYYWNLNPQYTDSIFIVDSIKPTSLYNGEPSRIHYLSNHNTMFPASLELIEGMGSLRHPFGPVNELVTNNRSSGSELCCAEYLLCLTVDGRKLYQINDSVSCGELTVWTSIHNNDPIPTIEIFPNPAVDFLNIRLPSNTISDYVVTIFNNQGKKVDFEIINKSHKQILMNIEGFNSGIYHLVIKFEDTYLASKFVVIK